MANLTSGSIITGNVISASDITTLYDVFTGAQTYENINIPTGSIFNSTSASFATSASQAANAVNADNIAFTVDSTNTNRFVPFTSTAAGDGNLLTDGGIVYNPSTNVLTTSASYAISSSEADNSFSASYAVSSSEADNAVTASYAISSSEADNAVTATNLSDFANTDRSGNPTILPSPMPLAFTIPILNTSGTFDVTTIGVGAGGTAIGENIFFTLQYSANAGELDTSVDLAVTYSYPIIEVTGSAGLTGAAVGVGWTTRA